MSSSADVLFISRELRDSVAAVVNYDFATEERDYCHQHPSDREGHVFEHLQRLDAWLRGNASR